MVALCVTSAFGKVPANQRIRGWCVWTSLASYYPLKRCVIRCTYYILIIHKSACYNSYYFVIQLLCGGTEQGSRVLSLQTGLKKISQTQCHFWKINVMSKRNRYKYGKSKFRRFRAYCKMTKPSISLFHSDLVIDFCLDYLMFALQSLHYDLASHQ